VTDYHDDSARRRDPFGGPNHVVEQARPSCTMQDLGPPRAHARSQAGGQDYDGNGGLCHSHLKLPSNYRFYEDLG
jgi:hypothetical protein